MSTTYSTLGTEITVRSQGTATAVGFNRKVAIVGGMDTDNGSAQTGSAVQVDSKADAQGKFGDGSELHEAVGLAYSNGISDVQAVPVPETTGTTESFASTQSGALGNAPVFDPNINSEHTITAQDTGEGTSATVNMVYTDTVSAPSSSNTINLNPITGDWKADATSSYDITYDHGDYSSSVIETAAEQDVRFVIVLTENTSVGSTLIGELSNRAQDFDFKRGVIGARPNISGGSTGSYTDSLDDQRLVVVAPSRGLVNNNEVRTTAAVGSLMAAQPLGLASLYDPVNGVDEFVTEYTDSEAKSFSEVTAVTKDFKVAKAVTTSSESGFQDVYATEIIDTITLGLHQIAEDYAGDPYFGDTERLLEESMNRFLEGQASLNPPLLADPDGSQPYSVTATEGSSEDIVDVTVGIKPVPVMKTVNVNLNVGDVVIFEGAESA